MVNLLRFGNFIRLWIICCILFCFTTASAQNAKLEILWNQYHQESNDSARLKIFNDISWASLLADPELGMQLAEEMLCMGEKIGIHSEDAAALNYLGVCNYIKGDNKAAFSYYKLAGDKAILLQDSITIAAVLNNQALMFVKLGLYEDAFRNFTRGVEIARSINNIRDLAMGLNNMGATLEKMEEFDEAIPYFNQAISIANENNFPLTVAIAMNHLGSIAMVQGQLDSAMYFYRTALMECDRFNDQLGKVNIYIELAKLFQKQNEPDSSFIYLNEAMDIATSLKYRESIGRIRLAQANLYLLLKSYNQAIDICKDAIEQEQLAKANILVPDFYQTMSESYAGLGQHQLAYTYHKRYKSKNDSIYHANQQHIIHGLEIKHQLAQTEKENAFLQIKQEQNTITLEQRNSQIAAAVVIILLSLIIALISYQSYLRKKEVNVSLEKMVAIRTEELEESNKNLERFAHIASHDLKEPLRNITGFVQLLSRKLKQQNLVDDDIPLYLDFIQAGTRQIKTLIEDVLAFTTINKEDISPNAIELADLVNNVLMTLKSTIQESGAIVTASELPRIYSVSTLLFVILKNLIENGIKYNQSEVPTININCEISQHEYLISVRDNGIGIEPEYQAKIFELFARLHDRSQYQGSGLGLAICQKIIHQLQGKLWVESRANQGSTFYISLPKSQIVPMLTAEQAPINSPSQHSPPLLFLSK